MTSIYLSLNTVKQKRMSRFVDGIVQINSSGKITRSVDWDFVFSPFHNTAKPAHVVTFIKQSPVLKDNLFLILS